MRKGFDTRKERSRARVFVQFGVCQNISKCLNLNRPRLRSIPDPDPNPTGGLTT